MHKIPFFPYIAAVVVTLIAVWVRWLLNPFLGQSLALVTLYGAIAYISRIGGLWPTLFSAVLGYFLCNYFIIAPQFAFNFGLNQIIGFAAYSFTCGIIIWLGELTHKTQKRLQQKETERQAVVAELRESERNVRTILESITDSFYTLDTDWRFSYVNPAAEKALGRKAEDLVGKYKWDEYPETLGGDIETLYRKVMAEKVSSTVTTYYAPHSKWYEIRAYPTDNGLAIYFRDVTSRIVSETMLKQQSNRLAETDRRKDEFLATLAHELRNPLAPIRNSLSIMELKGHDVASAKKASAVIGRQVNQMVRLVDDLMDVSRINHGKLELRCEQIDLSWAINNAIESSRPVLEAAQIELILESPSEPIVLNADLTRLSQVFINILNNAAKYTDPHGQVKIKIELNEPKPDNQQSVLIKISDTGIGISGEHLPMIFDAFTQLPSSLKRSHGGLGVGLMLVRKLVELHEGSISVHSEGPGLGTTVSVELPVMSGFVTSSRNTASDELSHSPNKLRILVVDDNQDAANSLSLLLEATGNDTFVVHDGRTALDAVENYQPNVVLLDIGMPDLNGYEVASRIRGLESGKNIKLFAVTGWGQENDVRKSHDAGFDAHLVKPVDPQKLFDLLSTVADAK